MGQNVGLLHALIDTAGDVFREQHRGIGAAEKFLHIIAVRALHLDVKALELTLEGIQALHLSALVLLAGVQGLQHLGETLARVAVHTLVQLQIFETIRHFHFLLKCLIYVERGPQMRKAPSR